MDHRSFSRLIAASVAAVLVPGAGPVFALPMEPQTHIMLGGGGASPPEEFIAEPMPPGVHVEQTDMDGPVFADAQGRTLYRWNSQSPGAKDKQGCDERIITVSSSVPGGNRNSGGEIFYPEGVLPDIDKRVACAKIWPPLAAAADSQPVGRWTIFTRPDGFKQWAYGGFPIYTSNQDHAPGEVNGGTIRTPGYFGNGGFSRMPIGPRPDVPPGFAVSSTPVGRLLTTDTNSTIFMADRDAPGKSHCYGECAKNWVPVIAPQVAQAKGVWSFVDRGQGVKQWAYRGKALYTYSADHHARGLYGAEVPGWRPAILKNLPDPPSWVTAKDTPIASVFADANGKTLYLYTCTEPAEGDLSCDNPDTTQVYRIWMCGYNDVERCHKTWPMVPAAADAKSNNKTWSAIWVTRTGHRADAGTPGALHVWAFRGKPVYTFVKDKVPDDVRGDGIGEQRISRQGFGAFRIRSTEIYPPNGP